MNERVPLSFLITQNAAEDPPVVPRIDRDHPLVVWLGEEPWVCTAVLDKTVVLASTGDRYLTKTARHDQVNVDPGVVEWRTKASTYEGARLNSNKPGEAQQERRRLNTKSPWRAEMEITYGALERDRAQQRQESDARALENQQQVRKTEEKEVRFLRQRSAQQAAQKEKEEVQATTTGESIVSIPLGELASPAANGSLEERAPGPAKKVKLRHCHRCGEDKPKIQFKTKRGKGVCEECRAKPELKVGRAIGEPRVQVAEIPPDGTVVELSAPAKRKYTRRAKAGKRGRRKSENGTDKTGAKVTVPSTGHRNGRPSLTFKELIERIVSERDSLKARVVELEAERAMAFAQLQEVLG